MLAVSGEGKIACNQVLYHLQERAIEHAVIPWCARHGVAVVAYSPFGHDDFPAPASAGGKLLAKIADAHKATPRQVALSFLVREHRCSQFRKPAMPSMRRKTPEQANSTLGEERDCRARCGVSARAETAKSPDAVQTAARKTAACARTSLTDCFRLLHASRASHIGIPLSDVVDDGQLSFSASHQIRKFLTAEICRDSASRSRGRQARQRFRCRCPKRSPPLVARRRAPTVRSRASR